jgi:oxygen-independent coproporphyrinogen-3 oxidase
VALAGHDLFMHEYHNALVAEIVTYVDEIGNYALPLDTIFFGGGTPSTYPTELLLDTFAILNKKFAITSKTEITIEVNPGTVSEKQISTWKELGINRMSVGVQSLKDGALHDLNRMQTYDDVIALFSYAHNYIPTISIDLIIGLPNVNDDEWKSYIEEVVLWPIEHISIYFLTIHEDTPLYFRVTKKNIELPSDERIIALYYWTITRLEKAGFVHYELSNFARNSSYCRHNMAYWERKPYKGFGLGACSFDGASRFQNEKNLTKYLAQSSRVGGPVIFTEQLEQKQVYLEKIMLQLRCMWGISYKDLCINVAEEKQPLLQKKIDELCQEGFLSYIDNDTIRLTIKGLIVENQIVMQLLL